MDQVVCNPHFKIVGYNKDALIVRPEPDVPVSIFFYEIYEFLRRNSLNYSRVEYEFGGVKSFADITDFDVSISLKDTKNNYSKSILKPQTYFLRQPIQLKLLKVHIVTNAFIV